MLRSSYAASFGRLRAVSLNFLSKEFLRGLARMKDPEEIADALQGTWYRRELELAASVYRAPALVEVAVNRHLVTLNTMAVQASPLFARRALLAYLSRWDIENIELILAAKSLGRSLEETESFLVSSRNIPVGMAGNVIPHSDLKLLLQQADVEAVVNQLVKYGYGAVLLQELGEFRRTGDLGGMVSALQKYYYDRLLWELRFLKGDEGVLREYVRAEVAKRNILNVLKGRESGLDKEAFSRHLIEGGLIAKEQLLEAYGTPSLSELVKRFEPWFNLSDALQRYEQSDNLSEFEVSMDRLLVAGYMGRFRSLSLSSTAVFSFVLQAEVERQNIRRTVYGRQYGMPEEYINAILLVG
ncbi:MAG: V-type ATPase subunit [Nitrososphaerota archaeon]|nr:V-type ATPase subunit [Nitrososphaerota archaeon]